MPQFIVHFSYPDRDEAESVKRALDNGESVVVGGGMQVQVVHCNDEVEQAVRAERAACAALAMQHYDATGCAADDTDAKREANATAATISDSIRARR